MSLPLSGVKVIEVTEAAAGPFAGMMLADMGADVIKVEKPTGDVIRHNEPSIDGVSVYFLWPNRNKRCISVNLKDDRGTEIFHRLAADADIILENYAPGVVSRLGIDYENIVEQNENVIYCHISGFGQTGPYASRKVIDQVMQGESGIMSVTGLPDHPAKTGFVYTDITTAMYTAFQILSAYVYRLQTGRGQEIDASMWDVQVLNLGLHGYRYLLRDEVAERMGTKYPAVVPYQAFETSDGEYINVCVITDEHWQRFCLEVIDRSDLADDDRFSTNEHRVTNRDILEPELEAAMKRKPASEWESILVENGIPAAPLNDVSDVIHHPQTQHRELIESVDHPLLGSIQMLGFPGEFDEIDQRIRRPPPGLGEHTREILTEHGYSRADIESFLDRDIVIDGQMHTYSDDER